MLHERTLSSISRRAIKLKPPEIHNSPWSSGPNKVTPEANHPVWGCPAWRRRDAGPLFPHNASAKDSDDFAPDPVCAEFQPRNAKASLRATFLPDRSGRYVGLYRGARCVLPTGEVVEVHHKQTPLYDLARELEARGYGAAHLQSYTHTGTPSLHGLVKIMAGLTVEESGSGLRLRKYRPARGGESVVDAREDD